MNLGAHFANVKDEEVLAQSRTCLLPKVNVPYGATGRVFGSTLRSTDNGHPWCVDKLPRLQGRSGTVSTSDRTKLRQVPQLNDRPVNVGLMHAMGNATSKGLS